MEEQKKHYLLTLSLACPESATEEEVGEFEKEITKLAKEHGYLIGGTSMKI